MINMKVIRVKAKVASSKIYTQEDMDAIRAELTSCRSQIMSLKQKNTQLEADIKECEQTSKELASRLCTQIDATHKAEENAADLNLELMERQCRIDELERRIEWLSAHSDTDADFIS